jgi:hypothetical protein
VSKQRLKQNWSRKEEGLRLNLWLTTGVYHSLKEFCDREELTPSLAIEECLLERDLLRTQLGMPPILK